MVGLEDVLDFQKFLLDTQGWPVDGNRHRLIVREKSDIEAFLRLLANFGKVGVDSGNSRSTYFMDVETGPNHLVIWGSDTGSDIGAEKPLVLVPDYLKIIAESDPRNSYAKLVNNPLARIPPSEFAKEAFNPILFYPAHSLVPIELGQGQRFVTASEKSDFAMTIDKRMDKFFAHVEKRYPLAEIIQKSISADDALIYEFTVITASRPHEHKRERVMYEWLYEHIPFPVDIIHRICGTTKAGTNIKYVVSFKLPE